MTFNYQQNQNQDSQQFQQITSLDQVLLQPIQNSDISQQRPQNLAQQSYGQQIQQAQNYVHQQIQSYGQYNQNNNNVMMTTQALPQQQPLYNSLTSSPTIYNNDDDLLILRISGRLSMIKDSIMTINQQYTELEQDFIKLRRKYNHSC
nr:10428_t:CDS:1 [Entrophospora candida]